MLTQLSTKRRDEQRDLVTLLAECHQRIRHFLRVAATVARDAALPTEQVVEGCDAVTRYFAEAFPLHVLDEEQSVEPRLRGRTAELDRTLDRMAAQHQSHAPQVAQLLAALRAVRHEPAAPAPRAALGRQVQALQDDLFEHLTLEEAQLFPAVRALDAQSQAQILAELRSRRSPLAR